MIERYTNLDVAKIWDDLHKLMAWTNVELAVLKARYERGDLSTAAYKAIESAVRDNAYDIEWWKKDEKDTRHDLNSAIKERQRFVPQELQPLYHKEMTSYDTEESAFLQHLLDSVKIVDEKLDRLQETLRKQAIKYRFTPMMGVTHGQFADVQSFGKRILTWYQDLATARRALEFAKTELHHSKLSGFVGNYTGITPALEKRSLEILGFEPYIGATQILPRVMMRPLASALGGISKVIAKIALDIRLGARSASVIYQEPFGDKQMGSSAGPQKRNTIIDEQCAGTDALIAGFEAALHAVEITWEERAIEQSCVERVAWPDIFHLLVRMLEQITKVTGGLKVYPQNMMREIIMTNGCYAASVAKEVLKDMAIEHGLTSEECYRIVQLAAFNLGYPTPDEFVPESLAEADLLLHERQAKPIEPEPRDSIRGMIMFGLLRTSDILVWTDDEVAAWNKKLLDVFMIEDNRSKWQEVFLLSFLLGNEDYLFKYVFGV